MNKSRFLVLVLLSMLALSMCNILASAYGTETIEVTIGPDGIFTGVAEDSGIAYEIRGNPGATGTVTAEILNGNPYATATFPEEIKLTYFVRITFNMYSGDFNQAKIFITYTDANVLNIHEPYTVYKYNSVSDSYVKLNAVVDTAAQMITITVNSTDDPLFAIGGAIVENEDGGPTSTAWIVLIISIIVIVLLAVFGVWYLRKRSNGD